MSAPNLSRSPCAPKAPKATPTPQSTEPAVNHPTTIASYNTAIVSDKPPKSAVELAMERLRQQDEESGIKITPLTESQTAAIADARRTYEGHLAECRILHESAMRTALDPEARAQLEANHRRDLSRFATDRDRKIERIRKGQDITD